MVNIHQTVLDAVYRISVILHQLQLLNYRFFTVAYDIEMNH